MSASPEVPLYVQAEPQERWRAELSATASSLVRIADSHVPLLSNYRLERDFRGPLYLPVESFQHTENGGIYRVLQTRDDYTRHVELDYFPDPDREPDQPIVRLTATIFTVSEETASRRQDKGMPTLHLQCDYGVKAESAGKERFSDIKVDHDLTDYKDLEAFIVFINEAGKHLKQIGPELAQINLASITNFNTESRLEGYLGKYILEASEADDSGRRVWQSQEDEVAKAAKEELDSGLHFKGDLMGDDLLRIRKHDHQVWRVSRAVSEILRRNLHRPIVPVGYEPDHYGEQDFWAGLKRKAGPQVAEAEASRFLRTILDHESKIPPEGLVHIPEGHIIVFITQTGKGPRATGSESPRHFFGVYTFADDSVCFTKPYFYNPTQEADAEAVDVSFSKIDTNVLSIFPHVGANFRVDKKGKHRRVISRLLLLGPGDTSAVAENEYRNSNEFAVSNIAGELYINGKKISRLQKRHYQRKLRRLTGDENSLLIAS